MPVTTEIDVRYRDLDTLAHVNNAVIVTYVEEGRTAYAEEVFEYDVAEYSFVVASLSVDFEHRVTLEDTVTATTSVSDLGTTSVTMPTELSVGDQPVASAETTLVFLGPESGEPAPVPDPLRERVEAYEDL